MNMSAEAGPDVPASGILMGATGLAAGEAGAEAEAGAAELGAADVFAAAGALVDGAVGAALWPQFASSIVPNTLIRMGNRFQSI